MQLLRPYILTRFLSIVPRVEEDALERMLRRVVREELQRFHVGGLRAPKVVYRPQRQTRQDEEEGVRNIERTLDYANSIDPDNTMPKDELLHLMRMKFPEFEF